MMKRKVRMSPSLLLYRQEMNQLVNDIRDEKLQIAARVKYDIEPFMDQTDLPGSDKAGLLIPPRIESLVPEFYPRDTGEIEGIVHIITSDYFGISSFSVTIRDEAGNLLESGEPMRDETCVGLWTFLPGIAPVVDTSLILRAVATDALGGLSIAETRVTLTEEYLRTASDLLDSRE